MALVLRIQWQRKVSFLWSLSIRYLKNAFAMSSIVLVLSATGFFIITAMVEEKENLTRFGASYAIYMRGTRRFVPFLF